MVDIKSVARKVIQDETVAIQNLINYIDDDFEAVVRLIYENKGRVIITGIGKSAIIATKIVATMNSLLYFFHESSYGRNTEVLG